jgi:uncharacterized coiled-coil protein SlyX
MNHSTLLAISTPPIRNLISRSPLRRAFLPRALALALFALLPTIEAQLPPPPPDGGYPGGNTAEGDGALFNNQFNLAAGTGIDNTAMGKNALDSNTTGNNNTAIGFEALFSNTTGHDNTAMGLSALFSNTTGHANTATGSAALGSNNAGNNTAMGASALQFNTTGGDNTATGAGALMGNTTGFQNTADGSGALFSNNGDNNTATGFNSLTSNTTGNNNTADGLQALTGNTSGTQNTATGVNALAFNKTGNNNTAIGYFALQLNTGSNNTACGESALGDNKGGSNNIALGTSAGINLTTGSNNIDIGNSGVAGETAKIRIGKQGTQNGTFIAGISGVGVTGSPVLVTTAGKLGIMTSSARFKEGIKPMDKSSEAILALKPVTFRYKEEIDPDTTPQFGLVAEEVEKVDPELVVHDEEGKPFTVRYDAVNVMLLNEFLRQRRTVQEQTGKLREQETTITRLEAGVAEQRKVTAEQQKQIETLTNGLRNVSNQIEVLTSSPTRVAEDH